MSPNRRSWKRLGARLAALGLAGALSACAPGEQGRKDHAESQASSALEAPSAEAATAQPTSSLLVDDAKAANPALVSVPLEAPPGFSAPAPALRLPAGFKASVLAAGLSRPRFMALDEAGALLVATMGDGRILRYPAVNGVITPRAQPPAALASGLAEPSSLALHDGFLYVGETRSVARYPYKAGGALGAKQVVVPALPTGYHSTKTVAFGPDGKLYVSIGSSCNICEEEDERRAAISRYNPDGSGYQRFAWGLRNAVGLAFQPGTGALWATVNERDRQGNEIPPDLVTIVKDGADYGWPNCQPPRARPQTKGANCEGVTPPTIGIQAHSAPLGLAFGAGSKLPAAYQNSLFVAQHGSWNRQPPAAPKLLQIVLDGERPVSVRDFATGWQNAAGQRWGRPVGVVVAQDGSLIVSDDDTGMLYRLVAP